jgi:integrase
MLLEHRARRGHTGPLVFATRSGRAIGQRNLLRALCTAQERARTRRARRLSPSCSSTTSAGTSWSTSAGEFVPRRVDRREPKLPDFHALRHTAAMDCDDAEEARDLLRHKNSNVTRAVYRAHFSDRRRELLRARMEARHRNTVAGVPSADRLRGEIVPLDRAR